MDASKVYQLNSTALTAQVRSSGSFPFLPVAQALQLQAAFELVDRLELMVSNVRTSVNQAEDVMRSAEDQLDQSTLKKTWKLIPGVGGSAPPPSGALPPLPRVSSIELLAQLREPVKH